MTSTETTTAIAARRAKQAGFTMTELIIVLVLAGILAAYAFPKMAAAINSRDDAWHDSLQSALRFAQKGAVARRRLTCVSISATTVTLSSATTNPANTCSTTLNGPSGTSPFATTNNTSAGTSGAPSSTLYFQPDGRVTTDGDGSLTSDFTITMSGASSISVNGVTGYVE